MANRLPIELFDMEAVVRPYPEAALRRRIRLKSNTPLESDAALDQREHGKAGHRPASC
jgi:hypothetical protein